jgi:FMN-dependent dehydrogenase
VVCKGVQTGEDALAARHAGAAAVVVSNHGGRQLEGARATLDALPEVIAEVGPDFPVLMDGGIRSGGDVLIALAMGASAVLVGRPVLHGLAVGGASGATAVLTTLIDELIDAMGHCGRPSLNTIGPDLITPTAETRIGSPAWSWQMQHNRTESYWQGSHPRSAGFPEPLGSHALATSTVGRPHRDGMLTSAGSANGRH